MTSSTIQRPEVTFTTHCKVASSEFDNAPKGASLVEYENEYEKSNAALHLAWNAWMAEGVYKSPSFYKNVSCLLLSWDRECEDIDTENEVAALASVFVNTFHFNVKRITLTDDPIHLPHVQVMKHISEFLWEKDRVHSLLLFYYGGHGCPKPLRDGSNGLALTGKHRNYDNAGNSNEVLWGYLEDSFQHTKADVLEIFDCCNAGDLGRTRHAWGTRSFEFLGACSSHTVTSSPGKGSFTTALIWALEALVRDQTRFTLSELSCKIRKAPDFPPDQVPVQFDRGAHTLEQIIIAPLPETGNETGDDESSALKGSDDAVPQRLLHLNFFFEKPPSRDTIDKFARGLNRLVHEQELPINRIVWGGLVSWGGAQPFRAGKEAMMKVRNEEYLRRKSKKDGDKTVQPSGSDLQLPSFNVSDALPQSNAIPSKTLDQRCHSLLDGFQAILQTDLRNEADSSLFEMTKLGAVASRLEDLRFRFGIWISDIGIDLGMLSENDELTKSTSYRVIVTAFDRIESQLTLMRSGILVIKNEIEKTSSLRFSMIKLVRFNLSSKSTKAFNRIRDSSNIIESVLRNLADIVAPSKMLHAIHSGQAPFVEFQNNIASVKKRVEAEQGQKLIEQDISAPAGASNEENISLSEYLGPEYVYQAISEPENTESPKLFRHPPSHQKSQTSGELSSKAEIV